jgi:hypothetical protein
VPQRGAPIAETLDEALEKAPSPHIAACMLRQAMWVVTIVFGPYGAWEAYGLTRFDREREQSGLFWDLRLGDQKRVVQATRFAITIFAAMFSQSGNCSDTID